MEAGSVSSVRMSLRAKHAAAEIRLPSEVNWEMLDKTRFFLLGAALFSGVNAVLYPSMVLKTQQQILPGNISSSTLGARILKNHGLPGLYKGFTTSLMGTIPARALYMSTLEITKSAVASLSPHLGLSHSASCALSNAAGGMSAAVAAQLVWTPVDVISQRLMVQGAAGENAALCRYRGGVDAFRTILRTGGVAGLYRGFGMSIITYAPSNAVWWASYSGVQRAMWKGLGIDHEHEQVGSGTVLAIQAASSALAGGISAVVTTPLDTIKTRMQVLDDHGKSKAGFGRTVKQLVAEEGWKGCYKGFGPRWASMTLSAMTMITTYEFVKRMSTKAGACSSRPSQVFGD